MKPIPVPISIPFLSHFQFPMFPNSQAQAVTRDERPRTKAHVASGRRHV